MPTKNFGIPYIDEEEQRVNLVKETSDAFNKIDEAIARVANVMKVEQDESSEAFTITFFGSAGKVALTIPKTATSGASITIAYTPVS